MKLPEMEIKKTTLFSIRDRELDIFIESEDASKIEKLRNNLEFYKLVTWALENNDETTYVSFNEVLYPKEVRRLHKKLESKPLYLGDAYNEVSLESVHITDFSLEEYKDELLNFCNDVRTFYNNVSGNEKVMCIKNIISETRKNYELSEKLRKHIEDYG